jgi:hypothetical protein
MTAGEVHRFGHAPLATAHFTQYVDEPSSFLIGYFIPVQDLNANVSMEETPNNCETAPHPVRQ